MILKKLRAPAPGGVAAQGTQAVGSFVIQFATARILGLDALVTFGVCYSLIVLATAISSGFVGDSLTVLDRADPKIRSALQAWAGGIALGSAVACATVAYLVGFLSGAEAVFFGLATAAFVVEDLVRRLLMATLDFWRIVIVDLVALAGSLSVFVVVDDLVFVHVLAALVVGQTLAFAVGVALLPASERHGAGWTPGGIGAVASFGVWRSMQQAVRAGTMAAMRVVLLLAVTTTAVGRLELARIYVAPAALGVAGIGSYLFASYAGRKGSAADLLARADRAVLRLLVMVGIVGGIAVAAVPILGPLFTPSDVDAGTASSAANDGVAGLSAVAAASWAAFAATSAAVMPYGQLAAIQGSQRAVFALRVVESVLSLGFMLLVVEVTGSVNLAPAALAFCAIPTGISIRRYLLLPEARRTEPANALVDRSG